MSAHVGVDFARPGSDRTGLTVIIDGAVAVSCSWPAPPPGRPQLLLEEETDPITEGRWAAPECECGGDELVLELVCDEHRLLCSDCRGKLRGCENTGCPSLDIDREDPEQWVCVFQGTRDDPPEYEFWCGPCRDECGGRGL